MKREQAEISDEQIRNANCIDLVDRKDNTLIEQLWGQNFVPALTPSGSPSRALISLDIPTDRGDQTQIPAIRERVQSVKGRKK